MNIHDSLNELAKDVMQLRKEKAELLAALEGIVSRSFGAGVGSAEAVPFVKVPSALVESARTIIAKAKGHNP